MMNLYKGKLTYTLSVVALAWAAVGYFMFDLDGTVAVNIAWVALAAFGIRRAMK